MKHDGSRALQSVGTCFLPAMVGRLASILFI
jgi:hypothetical protein